MMPARRAAPRTSPFFALPASTRSSVFAVIVTRPSATATRSVAAFADTSTMRASPLRPRWLSLRTGATALLRGAKPVPLAADQGAGGGRDITLAHQAFADQEGRNADGREKVEIGRRENAAFADADAPLRYSRRQTLAGGQRRLDGPQLAVVDADQAGAPP